MSHSTISKQHISNTQHMSQSKNTRILTSSSYLNTKKETHILHKFRYLLFEVLKAAERNTRGKKAGKETKDKMTSQCLITFPAQASLANCYFLHTNYFFFKRFKSVLLTFQINVTASHFNLAQNHIT